MSARTAPTESLQGHYAGAASRTAAYVIDAALSVAIFAGALAAIRFLVELMFGVDWQDDSSLFWGAGLGAWEFLYLWYCWGMGGKTPGAALLGIRVVRRDGSRLGFGRAFVRTLVFPFSFVLLGLGLLPILVDREHRALHDYAAGSTVVYDWDARAAHLRFLARR